MNRSLYSLAAAGLLLCGACAPGPVRVLGSVESDDASTQSDSSGDSSMYKPSGHWKQGGPRDANVGGDASSVPTCDRDEDCAYYNGYCDTSRGVCVGCVVDEHCPPGRPYCLEGQQFCVQCLSNADCYSERPYCLYGWYYCAQCVSDNDCPGGYCDKREARCYAADSSSGSGGGF